MIAICIGHSRRGDNGAVSVDGISEHRYNSEVGRIVHEGLLARDIPAVLIDDYPTSSYGAAMRWLAHHLRTLGAAAAVELHFNAAGPSANGLEYLYWHLSDSGEDLASAMVWAQTAAFPQTRVRHRDGLVPRSTGNGTQFLRSTHCPAVIAEPFFGTNPDEWALYGSQDGKAMLATSYCEGIAKWLSDKAKQKK